MKFEWKENYCIKGDFQLHAWGSDVIVRDLNGNKSIATRYCCTLSCGIGVLEYKTSYYGQWESLEEARSVVEKVLETLIKGVNDE